MHAIYLYTYVTAPMTTPSQVYTIVDINLTSFTACWNMDNEGTYWGTTSYSCMTFNPTKVNPCYYLCTIVHETYDCVTEHAQGHDFARVY